MAFIHGKSAVVLQNEFNLSAYFNDISISRSIETAETTAFGSTAKSYIVGLIDGTLSLSGMFDGAANAIDQEMTDVLGVNAGAIISASVSGVTTIGTRMISTTGKLTSYEVTAPVGDVVSANAEFQASDGIGNAVSLAALGAITATTTGTSVDNGASSSNGGFATLHVTANTMNAATVCKVQHSADNSTWADLQSFTSVATTVVTAERLKVANGTTVNRYLRAVATPAGTGSFTYHINFARQ
ncbi:MAG: hypothetical protein EBR94_00695 [Bacteroidetes bacterium]|nr:hypothetical protein [Bacteroidota bacterium]